MSKRRNRTGLAARLAALERENAELRRHILRLSERLESLELAPRGAPYPMPYPVPGPLWIGPLLPGPGPHGPLTITCNGATDIN